MNISTQINKRSFGKNTVYQYFSLWEAGLQGAVYQPQKSLTMAALAVRCHLIQIRLVNLCQSCNFYHDQLPGFLRDDKNRISLFDLIEITGFGSCKLNLYFAANAKKARLFSSF